MSDVNTPALAGSIFEEYAVLSLHDLSRMCTVETHHIVELVDEGILDVAARDGGQWQFTGAALRRAQIALRLQRDLEVNLAGVALALELMEEIRRLQRSLQRIGHET
jgi:chaperone modulatory protein CbpM